MVVVQMRKGVLIMYIHHTKDPKMDYMQQANAMARPYINAGWHLVNAWVE